MSVYSERLQYDAELIELFAKFGPTTIFNEIELYFIDKGILKQMFGRTNTIYCFASV